MELTQQQKYMLGGAAAAILIGIYVMKRTVAEADVAKAEMQKENNKKYGTLLIVAGLAAGGYVVYQTQCADGAKAPESEFGALDSKLFQE